ncbi:MAG: gamma-glutamyltransferase family protein [Alphaproteobacteria bacterium]|nr:gamma-glutamyltransferase family protein [Alphaproteobacteria bacterium]
MSFTTRPEIRGTFGVVASTHWLASAAGMGALERGGNAFDAAVVAGLVLQVVEPHLNGPGGDMPALLWIEEEKRVEVLCGQGPAPAAATLAHYRGLGLDLIPGSGLLATCVPGATEAWLRLLRDHGTLSLEDALAPAIGYAQNGMPAVARIVDTIAGVRELFATEWCTSAAIWLPRGDLPKPGRLLANPTLAGTWQRLIAEAKAGGGNREAVVDGARRAWREGFIAEAIDAFCRDNEILDASGRRHRGVLTGADMAAWQSRIEAPLTVDYRGLTVAKCGVWSQGPAMLQQLRLLEGFDLASLDPTGPDFIHLVTEAAKLAFADRDAWYADPDFVDVPAATLLSRAYAEERRKLIGATASAETRPGAPDGRAPRLPTLRQAGPTATDGSLGEPTVGTASRLFPIAAGDTCHVDVIDRDGNMVSATPSGGWLQSSPAIPELGFALGTRMQMFWLQEGLPTTLAPGRRPRTTLSPTLVLKDGAALLAYGTPGGDQQDQWQAQFLIHHVDQGMNLQEAIDCPAFHNEHMINSFYPRPAKPKVLALEGRMPSATINELERRGHAVTVGGPWSEGRLSAAGIERGPDGMVLKAAANPRGMQGYAVGR